MSFYIIEGPNGAGKTSLIHNFANAGIKTLSSPNGTPLAKMLRPGCRGTEPWEDIDAKVQMLLFSAARLDEYIRLVHNSKEIVVADRWWTSTYVYQCILQGLSVDLLEETKHPEEKIDMVILLDAKDEILISRVEEERQKNVAHGKCSWTKSKDTMLRLFQIYREDLPKYLTSRHIKSTVIDTSNISQEQVFKDAQTIINFY